LGIEFVVRPLLYSLRMPWHGRGDTDVQPGARSKLNRGWANSPLPAGLIGPGRWYIYEQTMWPR
jgi:hypothetical protein